MPPGKPKSYPSMPSDIMGLRRNTINAISSGRVNQPSYQPTYAPTQGFTPSSQTRAGAMSGAPAPVVNPPLPDGVERYTGPLMNSTAGGAVGSTPYGAGPATGGPPPPPNQPTGAPPSMLSFNDWMRQNGINPSMMNAGNADSIRDRYVAYQQSFENQARSNTDQQGSQNIADMLRNLFPQNIPGPPGSPIAPLPGLDYVPVEDIAGPRQASPNFDPRLDGLIDRISGMVGNGEAGYGGGAEGAAVNTQSLDEILNPESEFFKRIMGTYGDAFTQQRSQALAQAKESAGNLTGSGLANTLGTTVNRSLADEQKQLTDALLEAAGVEVNRQTQTGIATANNQTQASIASAQLRAQAAATGRQDLLVLANLLDSQGQNQANREQQTNLADFDFRGNRAFQNAGTENDLNKTYFAAGVDRNSQQASMDQQRMLAEYAGALGLSGQAAQNFTNFLSTILNQGVGPNTIVQNQNPWIDILKAGIGAAGMAF